MPALPESGIKLVAETEQAVTDVDNLIASVEEFESIGDQTISLGVEVDTSGVDLGDLPLDGETIDLAIETSVEGDPLPFEGDENPQIDAEVDVTQTDTAEKTLSAVETLRNLKIIETVWNIAGNAVELLGNVKTFAVDPLLSVEEAVAKVNAQTGFAIPNADKLINGIFYDDLGSSIDQVGNMVVAASQLGAPVDEAARAALAFTKVFDDASPIDVLNTLNQMVTNHLAPGFTEAGDLLTVAFQNGANRAGDLLTTINNNATALDDLGVSGPEALSFITSGLDAGFKSAQSVVDVLVKIKQNVTNAAGNDTSDVSTTLDILGIANPAETGEAWSADFFTSVIDAIKTAPGLTDTEREALFTNLVGGKQGAKTFSSFLEITPEQASTIFANVEGAAVDAGVAIDDSLRGAIDDFMLAAQQAATEFLSSESIDLPGKIAALKTGIQDALNTLSEGGTLGDALTVALKPIGFDDEFQGLESMLGNFVIALLQVVSSIQSLSPENWEAKKGTDAAIARLGEQQLSFDLTVGNADEISGEISTAIARGVGAGDISEILSTTVGGLIESGAVTQAQAVLDAIQTQAANYQLAPDLSGLDITVGDVALREGGAKLQEALDQGIVINTAPALSPEAVAGLQANIDAAVEASQGSVEELIDADFGMNLDAAATKATDLAVAAETTTAPVGELATTTATQGTNAAAAAPAVAAVATATKEQASAAVASARPVSMLAGSLSSVAGNAPAAAAGLSAVNGALTSLMATARGLAGAGATNVAKTGKALGGNATGTFMAGEQGREIITTDRNLAVLNNRTTEQIMAALQGYIPGGSFSGRGGNSFSVVNNNIVQSEAQADSLGYSTAANIRGLAAAQG